MISKSLAGVAAALAFGLASPAFAQDSCRFLCPPSLKVEPTITFSNLFNRPRVQELPNGGPMREQRETDFEIILSVDIPTELPRVGFTFETIWMPFGRDNPVELEFELNLTWLESKQTGGWLSSHVDLVDKFSPSERPRDRSVYTHKLNFELDTAVALFNWLPERRWLRGVELEGSLDYVATGLPKAGDEIGGERFVDDASRWSFSLVFVIPVAPE